MSAEHDAVQATQIVLRRACSVSAQAMGWEWKILDGAAVARKEGVVPFTCTINDDGIRFLSKRQSAIELLAALYGNFLRTDAMEGL